MGMTSANNLSTWTGTQDAPPNVDVLQNAITGYSDEAYTTAKKLSSTAIVGGNPNIDTNTETFIGQVRWYKPLNPYVNVASLTDKTPGTKTNYSSDFLNYIKTVRTHGAEKVNMTEVVTRVDGLAKVGRDFGQTRAMDEHNAILSVLKGVAISEAIVGAVTGGAGGQTWSNLPESTTNGFYVDLGSSKIISGPGLNPAGAANLAYLGAARAEGFLEAFGKAYKDYEPEYAYLITSPSTLMSLRSANLVDEQGVVDGNINFSTIFGGKFRLLQTRESMGLSSAQFTAINAAGTGTDIATTQNTTFIVLPGALALEQLAVPDQTEITRDGNAFKGGGITSIWYRWGYVLAPAGYNWAGSQTDFPDNAGYMAVWDTTATAGWEALTAATTPSKGVWERKASSVLSLGILPVFHA
jgi:hypothetical protein